VEENSPIMSFQVFRKFLTFEEDFGIKSVPEAKNEIQDREVGDRLNFSSPLGESSAQNGFSKPRIRTQNRNAND